MGDSATWAVGDLQSVEGGGRGTQGVVGGLDFHNAVNRSGQVLEEAAPHEKHAVLYHVIYGNKQVNDNGDRQEINRHADPDSFLGQLQGFGHLYRTRKIKIIGPVLVG